MAKILFAVCDDDQVVCEAIYSQVKSFFFLNGIDSDGSTFYTPNKLLNEFNNKPYNLLFLDIDMPGFDGISTAKKIGESGLHPVIIFVSNLENRVFETFSVQPFSFIRKAHFKEDFQQTMQNYIETYISQEMSLTIETNSQFKIQKLQINNIVFVESFKNIQRIHLNDKPEPLDVRITMNSIEQELKKYDFVRVHKGYLVNMRYIKKIEKNEIELSDGNKAYISRGKANDTKEAFAHYLRKTSSVLFEKQVFLSLLVKSFLNKSLVIILSSRLTKLALVYNFYSEANEMNKDLEKLYKLLEEIEVFSHASQIINYDFETACPKGGMSDDARDMSEFSAKAFKITKSKDYISLVTKLYKKEYDKLGVYDKRLVKELYKSIQKDRYVDAKTQKEASTLFNNAYIIWTKAKEDNSYKEFEPTLEKVYKMDKKLLLLRKNCDKKNLYNTLFDDYEEGFTTTDLDKFFGDLEKGIVPLVKKIREAKYTPRHDFLTRKVPLSKQEEFTKEILKFNGFDFDRGSVSTTIHPFTEQFGPNDVRVTTHYYETNFISNMYSIIHEGGHALFGQNIPKEVYTHHLGEGFLSMAKHESVSRFYENVIGRSKEYITAIYPSFQKIFKDEMSDVSINDFYEGVNYVDLNNPLRTEADELTYSLHIIIRYKLEREIMAGKCDFKKLNSEWNRLYKEILGVDNKDDKTGVLQDVHWCSGFGYFPTYALGNALNCIYVKALDKDVDLKKTLLAGHMDTILDWMKNHVFKKAALLNTKDWIKEISGEEFSALPYVDYLTKKYTEIYHLKQF